MKKLVFSLLCLIYASLTFAQEPKIFGINEGVTYRVTPSETRDKYKPLMELLSQAIKTPLKIEPVELYPKLRSSLEEKKYYLAYVHPAHHALRAIRDQKYQLVAVTKGYTDYHAFFLVKKDSALKQPLDIRSHRIGIPDPDSITSVIVRATLRDLGLDVLKQHFDSTRYQDAVPFMLEYGFNEVGAVGSAGVAKKWQQKGGKILFESKAVPIKLLIASPDMPKEDVEKVREIMINLDKNEAGKKILDKIGFKGYQAWDSNEAMAALKWLGI
jgi:ABC-type phosphate/phosphonate transport system substrate-binding protein